MTVLSPEFQLIQDEVKLTVIRPHPLTSFHAISWIELYHHNTQVVHSSLLVFGLSTSRSSLASSPFLPLSVSKRWRARFSHCRTAHDRAYQLIIVRQQTLYISWARIPRCANSYQRSNYAMRTFWDFRVGITRYRHVATRSGRSGPAPSFFAATPHILKQNINLAANVQQLIGRRYHIHVVIQYWAFVLRRWG